MQRGAAGAARYMHLNELAGTVASSGQYEWPSLSSNNEGVGEPTFSEVG